MSKAMEPTSDEVFHRLLALLRLTRQHGRRMIDESGLKPRDLSVLHYLKGRGPATVGEIGSFIQKSPSTTSALICELEEMGYVTRTRSEKDNRVVIVQLTPDGLDKVVNTRLSGMPLLHRNLGELSQAQLNEIDRILGDIQVMMETPEVE